MKRRADLRELIEGNAVKVKLSKREEPELRPLEYHPLNLSGLKAYYLRNQPHPSVVNLRNS